MMGILSFFLSPTSVLAPLAALAFGLTLGFGGGFLKGHDVAVTRYQVASLRDEVSQYKTAAEALEKQLESDREIAEAQEAKRAALEAEIEKVLHAPDNRSDVCRIPADRMQHLRAILTKAS